jgi:tRNA threonylcarbamoyladenosine biosynthesis protein TsaE
MGSGKTTLIKSIGTRFGVIDNVNSPTFSIVNEYMNSNNETFYHFDFYRIANVQEAVDIGCEEYFYSGNYCFIEWPGKVEPVVPEKHIRIDIINRGGNMRMFELKKYE